jgi:hypothetical protein
MADQINFEQRKLQKIKEAAHQKELYNLKSHHPSINPIS